MSIFVFSAILPRMKGVPFIASESKIVDVSRRHRDIQADGAPKIGLMSDDAAARPETGRP
jgi:hypothetical protein